MFPEYFYFTIYSKAFIRRIKTRVVSDRNNNYDSADLVAEKWKYKMKKISTTRFKVATDSPWKKYVIQIYEARFILLGYQYDV